ncbi:hypothetical protein APT_01590 [Acetobacter pasteurianus NBRC 101655]|uniref:DUF3325 family protein n=1 Tax=Acetobacter pasteurianus TaxID=438 RepID=UPI000245786C|nr:DUF3325 family protein [Acetobacter pasteurianus]BAU38672.1 hypothetical protein APT_01590 [Acetobacter pasteurianus NBRC 101655]
MRTVFLLYPALGLLLFFAFALLALTQFPHRRAIGLTDLAFQQTIWTRVVAGLLVILALVLAVLSEGGGFGILLWAGLLSLASCIVALILSWRPSFLAPLAQFISSDRFPIFFRKSS